jgi:hypothetical protein
MRKYMSILKFINSLSFLRIHIYGHGRTFIEKIVGKYSGDKLLNVRVQTDSQLSTWITKNNHRPFSDREMNFRKKKNKVTT